MNSALATDSLPASVQPPGGLTPVQVPQFILLGFGTGGKELQKAYNVRYLKEDSVGGQKCSRLELDPKDSKVKQHYSKYNYCIYDGTTGY